MKFIVEGRCFTKRLHAVTFAQGLACQYGRSVDIKAETRGVFNRVHRSWCARIHPPGEQRTLLKSVAVPHRVNLAI